MVLYGKNASKDFAMLKDITFLWKTLQENVNMPALRTEIEF
jgi:hypothetical protein